MYKGEAFRIRPQEEILENLRAGAKAYGSFVRRLFLADGDALVMPTDRILEILTEAFQVFPHLERAAAYATVTDILAKSAHDLEALKRAGLDILYIGLESGSDEVLATMHKHQTQADYVQAVHKAQAAGLRTSVTLIFGLGGRAHSKDHIEASAQAISLSQPSYVAFLSLQVVPGAPLYQQIQKGDFVLLTDEEEMQEMRRFVELVDSPGTIFRSNHASNPVAIGGTFNQDREKMLDAIDRAMAQGAYRPESWRGL